MVMHLYNAPNSRPLYLPLTHDLASCILAYGSRKAVMAISISFEVTTVDSESLPVIRPSIKEILEASINGG
jgi:hypothetical protein